MKNITTQNPVFSGNVGIGTTNPGRQLEVVGGSGLAIADFKSNSHQADSFLYITNTATPVATEVGSSATLSLSLHNQSGGKISAISTSDYTTNGNSNCALGFSTAFGNSSIERMRITSAGNVGIGTKNPNLIGLQLGTSLVVSSGTGGDIVAHRSGSSVNVGDICGALLIANSDTDGSEDHFVGIWGKVSSTNGSQDLHFAAGRSGYEGDAPHLTIDSAGNVGIGTTNPGGLLHIAPRNNVDSNGDPTNESYFKVFDNAASGLSQGRNGGVVYIDANYYTSTSDVLHVLGRGESKFVIKGNGNVGIGTTNPGGKLEVKADEAKCLVLNNDQAGGFIELKSSGDTQGYLQWGMTPAGATSGNDLLLTNTVTDGGFAVTKSGVAQLYVKSDGNVGIGTTNPSEKLDVRGSINLRSGYNLTWDGNGLIAANATNMQFYVAGGEIMRITSAGNVGIGTANPDYQLHTYKDSSVQQMVVEGDHGVAGWGGLASFRFTLTGTGISRNLTVGSYRPTEGINPCGTISMQSRDGGYCWIWMDDSNVLRFGSNSANIGATGGTALGTASTSDERLKNIEDDFEYGLSHVLQLQPIAFTFKNDSQGVRKLGFGAQTSQSIIPESVYDSGNCIDGYDDHPEHEGMNLPKSDDNELGMEYIQLIPVLTKAIQEQQQIIENLKSRIETLEQ